MSRTSFWPVMLCFVLGGCGVLGGGGAKDGGGGDDDDDDNGGGIFDNCSNEEKWGDDFVALMCTESETCGDGSMADIWCNPMTTTGGTTGTANCVYDADAACDCLDGTYNCNDDLTGFEFVEPPAACLEVYICN